MANTPFLFTLLGATAYNPPMKTRSKNVIIGSLITNAALVLLGLFGMSVVLFRYLPGNDAFPWYYSLTYYTNLSNMILIVGAALCLKNDILELALKKTKPVFFYVKFSGVITTLVTMTTVWIAVIFTLNPTFGVALNGSMWLLFHTICPLSGVLSFLFLDAKENIRKIQILAPAGLTIAYTVMMEILYATGGRIPYVSDFSDEPMKVNAWTFVILGLIESGLATGLGFLVRFLNNKKAK